MGGTMRFVVRDDAGTVKKFNAWTGVEIDLLHSKDFNEGKFQECLKNFGKIIRKYADGERVITKDFSPLGYGIIVVDFKEKKIHSMQGYNAPGEVSINRFSSVMSISKEERSLFDELMKLNYLDVYITSFDESPDKEVGSVHEVFGEGVQTKKIAELIKARMLDDDIILNNVKIDSIFHLSFKPRGFQDFTIVYYNDDEDGVKAFQKSLLEGGFKLTKSDKENWMNFIEE